ncbi:ATP-binding protein [[Mycoplasma] testudinis]|uniref:ATP-binding protein n=1 Tax=[Mycoplasma] testudinis TaxID=33924 RepID=UPI0004829912|nr:ATP-binding protein [[Mycoplasma] testudinis]
MKRFALEKLIKWKNSFDRKPLIVQGARQVGKTWLISEFGNSEFEDLVYINFEKNKILSNLFLNDLDPKRIINDLEIYLSKKIVPKKSLIFFDEIQMVEGGLQSLKYFCEDAPEYFVVAAGSLLGVALHKNNSFPVGKVQFLNLFPFKFTEFLLAFNETRLVEILEQCDYETMNRFSNTYERYLKLYYLIGGMPAAINSYLQTQNYLHVRQAQNDILKTYENDFSKHPPLAQVPKIKQVWRSLPSQLAKENKKFIYKLLRTGARASEFEQAMLWLSEYGLTTKVNCVNQIGLPLKIYENINIFKLYSLDVGLLGCLAGVEPDLILKENSLLSTFKGALTEQFICQELKAKEDLMFFYYANDKNTSEVDFVVQYKNGIVPLEVKAAFNTKSKSFSAFLSKFYPKLAYKISLKQYLKHKDYVDLPLYAVDTIFK